ncbi:MAG: hypothetical protein ABR508_05920 [Candidatus Baltobacteraceae bacterium]
MSHLSPQPANIRPHPLARELAQRLAPGAAILEIGAGARRNANALAAAGFAMYAVPDDAVLGFTANDARFDAVLSTHGFLHGLLAQLEQLTAQTARSLRQGALAHVTLASTADARFGLGRAIASQTFVQESGDEAGVAHTFFDRRTARALFETHFIIESLEETHVDAVAGAWAHTQPSHGRVHWFVRAVRR